MFIISLADPNVVGEGFLKNSWVDRKSTTVEWAVYRVLGYLRTHGYESAFVGPTGRVVHFQQGGRLCLTVVAPAGVEDVQYANTLPQWGGIHTTSMLNPLHGYYRNRII